MTKNDEQESRAGAARDPRGARDPDLDDWLADGPELDWFPEPGTLDQGGLAQRSPRGRRAGDPSGAAATARRAGEAMLRRPVVALAALVALGAGVALAFVILGGSGSGSPATSAPPTTAPAATTTTPRRPTTTTRTTTTTVTPPPTLTVSLPAGKLLHPGDTGSAVRALQRALAAVGFDPGAVDGSFGPGTKQAVVDFQTAQGLPADGVVGPDTVAKLNAALHR